MIIAARNAADVLKVSTDDQARDVMSMPVPQLGDATLVATLDTSSRPIHTEMTVNGKKYTGDFSNFQNDRMDDEIHYPFQISMKLDGKSIADVQVDNVHPVPYLVFPVPSEVAAK